VKYFHQQLTPFMKPSKSKFHPNNKHQQGYNFSKLCKAYPSLSEFVFENQYNTQTIDFANPKAVKALNTALLFLHYELSYWDFPDDNLCPPIPGRVDYIHHLADLLELSNITKNIRVLDIG
jgi:23S rRNA (adenine1618-N6)-methyltransferase